MLAAVNAPVEITLRPDGPTWASLVARPFAPTSMQRELREELGLPTDRPIIMTGHQAIVWHPGILAKYIAAEVLAERVGAYAAWGVVDHDLDDPWRVRFPTVGADGALGVAAMAVEDHGVLQPAMALPARVPTIPAKAKPASAAVAEGLAAIRSALRANASAANAAEQVVRATADLLKGVVKPAPVVMATALADTRMYSTLLKRMLADPGSCVAAYNAGVAAAPGAGLREMAHGDGLELPIWNLSGRLRRAAATTRDFAGDSGVRTAPRALLMTGMLRAGACDLFIHGSGGELYDRATERWLSRWAPELKLAPAVMATATMRLPLGVQEPPPEAEVSGAVWRAHSARHNPGIAGDEDGQTRKLELARAVRESGRGSARARAFRELHAFLGAWRGARGGELRRLDEHASEMRKKGAARDVIMDRTWAFPLFGRASLLELRGAIEQRL